MYSLASVQQTALSNEAPLYTDEYLALKKILISDPSKALTQANYLLEQKNTVHQTLNLLEIKVYSYLYTNKYSEAFAVIEEIANVVKNNPSPLAQWKLHYIQGTSYWHTEQGNQAIKHYAKAYDFIKPHQNYTYERANTENALGYISVKLGFYKEAIPYLTDSLNFNKKRNDPIYLGQAYNNLGEAYFGLEQYEKAAELHQQALAIRLKNKLTFHSSYSYHNLGLIYKVKNEPEKAQLSLLKAIEIRKENHFIKGLLASQLELAKLYNETEQDKASEDLLLDIILIAEKEKKYTTLAEAYKLQTQRYEKRKQFKEAFHALHNYQNILAKIQLNINDAELTSYITKLSTVTKNLDILSLNKANEIKQLKINNVEQRSTLIIIFGSIIVIILSVFLGLLHSRRKKIQNINTNLSITLENLRTTQAKLIESEKMSALTILVSGVAHKINTPLGNSVTAISHIAYMTKNLSLQVEANQITKNTFTEFITTLEQSCNLALNNMNTAAELVSHFKLLSTQLAGDKKEKFNILTQLQSQGEAIATNLLTHQDEVNIHGDNISIEGYPTALQKVLEHLINNSREHGQQEGKNLIIDIAVKHKNAPKAHTEHLEITYQDNGKGIDKYLMGKVFDPFYTTQMGGHNIGLGLSVVYNLVVQLMQGTISCEESDAGTTLFKITLPITITDA
ncbi:hypothetical protein GCM10009111_04550 [Colwellia asteriadis]|uniref:histidine kinase n=1 Tax=Colwellia asteriadis TaxID=517723 RepID=A0ABN1L371_9GAMM